MRWLKWKEIRTDLLRLDYGLLCLAVVLLATGCFTIYSTGQQTGQAYADYWLRQLAWVGLGSICFFAVAMLPCETIGRWAWLFYVFTLALLVLVLVVGKTINHSKSWLPIFGVTLQPAELAKPAALVFLAWAASRPNLRLSRIQNLIPLSLVVLVPMVLVVMQPDWGTALVFVVMAALVIFCAGMSWKWILVTVALAIALAPVGYIYVLKPHQRDRISNFLKPSKDLSDTGWNAHQSLLAVGSGGITGKGFMKGTQHVLGYLPRTVAPTDFVFSVIAEENGFVGAAVVVLAFAGIILRCLRTAALAGSDFGAYLCTGVAALFFTHAYINIGMTIQASPIIGIPLPLVSYGGSFMLSCMICLGLVQSVYVHQPRD